MPVCYNKKYNVYKKLTSPNVFYKLLNSGKIKENAEFIPYKKLHREWDEFYTGR